MPRGGARVRSGPPPERGALSRSDEEWLPLPAGGREGPVPEWPLSDPTEREWELWVVQWSKPWAVAWERFSQELEAAMLVRAVAVAEHPEASAADRNVVVRLMDSLGVTEGGRAKNRWFIDAGEERQEPSRRSTSSRDRLTVVSDAG